ncbi:MAG: hypothetical protein PUB12_04470 [[Clostridium] aminophilum]|uniref:hypothetical protein n=1 Tax=[Clostridium] aminophilum TaxID=1526 RepID=UPI0026EB5C3A|nr:hypothetical protein [[Clostridium] aminophilum]MDD6196123.1 hypothetical protein [[Clostridium] aminophilum]
MKIRIFAVMIAVMSLLMTNIVLAGVYGNSNQEMFDNPAFREYVDCFMTDAYGEGNYRLEWLNQETPKVDILSIYTQNGKYDDRISLRVDGYALVASYYHTDGMKCEDKDYAYGARIALRDVDFGKFFKADP